MTKGQRKCVSCGKFFDFEAFGFFGEVANEYEGKPICDTCRADDFNEPLASVVLASDNEKYTGRIGYYGVEVEDFSGYGSGTHFDNLVRDFANLLKWHASGAWRGSYQGEAPTGWERVIDSWFGSVDGHFPETAVKKFHDKWEVEQDLPDFEIFVAFPRTSNVCSTGIEVYVPTGRETDFNKWLGLEGGD